MPLNAEPKEAARQLALDLDNSVLPIQGPPGAGKTYVGGHMIAELTRQGKRIGVAAVSNKVIVSLLQEVLDRSNNTTPCVAAAKACPTKCYEKNGCQN